MWSRIGASAGVSSTSVASPFRRQRSGVKATSGPQPGSGQSEPTQPGVVVVVVGGAVVLVDVVSSGALVVEVVAGTTVVLDVLVVVGVVVVVSGALVEVVLDVEL